MKRGKNSRSNPSRSGNRRELGFSLRSLVLVFTPLLVVGCGGSEANIATSAAYSEPGWMAEVRSQNEEHTLAGIACLQAEGLNADSQSGMVTLQVDDELFPPGFVDQAWQPHRSGIRNTRTPSHEVWTKGYRTFEPWDPYDSFSGAVVPRLFSVSTEEMDPLQSVCRPSLVGANAVFDAN